GWFLSWPPAPVKTATTPGIACAGVVSTLFNLAFGYWLRTNSACSIPVGERSRIWVPARVTSRGSSTRRTADPMSRARVMPGACYQVKDAAQGRLGRHNVIEVVGSVD